LDDEPNLYIENGCFIKHPLINGCLGFQVIAPAEFPQGTIPQGQNLAKKKINGLA